MVTLLALVRSAFATTHHTRPYYILPYRLCHDYLRALLAFLSDKSYIFFPPKAPKCDGAWACYTT